MNDVTLGKPFFNAHDPFINWRTHHLSFENGAIPQNAVLKPVIISSAEFSRNLKQSNCEEMYRIKGCQVSSSTGRKKPNYSHCPIRFKMFSRQRLFLHYLRIVLWSSRLQWVLGSTKLPPAVPSFTGGAKDLIEVRRWKSFPRMDWALWLTLVPNIFWLPEKDPHTGKGVSRSEWIRSNNSKARFRLGYWLLLCQLTVDCPQNHITAHRWLIL